MTLNRFLGGEFLLRILSMITSLIIIIFIAKGFVTKQNPKNKREADKKWLDVLFIQYMIIFVGGILSIFYLIFQLVTHQ